MKILYDHQAFEMQKIGGISRYIAELIKYNPDALCSIRYSDNVYLQDSRFGDYKILPRNYEEERFLPGLRFRGKGRLMRYWCDFLSKTNKAVSIAAIKKNGFDIFHPTYYDTYFLEYLGKKPFVLTVHDMIHELFPLYFSERDATSGRKAELIHKAARINVNSQCTKNDLLRLFPEVEHKTRVIYHAYSMSIRENDLPRENYILFTGSRNGYKNFTRFVEAVAPLLRRHDLRLICTGGDFSRMERAQFEELRIGARVSCRLAGEDELEILYAQALLFVFPSLYEGFGIPVLEAFASGCPAVLSNTSSLPEIGGDAAVYFDPRDIMNMREVIEHVIDSPLLRQNMIVAGKEQVKKFSWDKCAAETMNVYERVSRGPAT